MTRSEPLEEIRRNSNAALASIGIGLRIECRGRRLNLRGLLPGRQQPGQRSVQRLSLGLENDRDGLREAEQIARVIDAQLKRDQFRWEQWIKAPAQKTTTSGSSGRARALLDQQLMGFEQAFFADPRRRRSPSGSRTTWTGAYNPYLRRLRTLAGQDKGPIAAELLLQTLHSYPDGSRSRQQCSTALGGLARHLELELPEHWRAEAAGYGLHRARFRQLPSDQQILESILQIPNPRWRLAYGLMATYGLRNHEVFFSDLSALCAEGDRVIRVLPTTKTGEHQVWPFSPEWVERFDLLKLGREPHALPVINTDLSRTTLQQVGRRVTEQFRRYDLPLTPYDLRHAWAVRTIHIGLPDTVSARMMGHSVAIHTRTYHHWITRRDQQQAVDAALARQHAS
ncbi:Phage integrase family protein [Synechococcus sp. MIT S9509]|uniref:site-specific integrase n=1 Tax=Synechococcus sp. MIT S9509 TaxID=1801630 RepID=UPI0007BB4FEC|nr:site-specific integrase [Synechococcus sp. MIT S9509]KZR92940.1 Phage integrase family protein [Synechococcus sp. MIT S9509]